MSMSDDQKRVAKILGVPEGEELPNVSDETMEIHHDYLSKHLSFPFKAKYSRETGPLENTYYSIKVVGLLDLDDCDDLEFYGLLCEARQGRRKIALPLAEVEVEKGDKNHQIVDDYNMWFWNYR